MLALVNRFVHGRCPSPVIKKELLHLHFTEPNTPGPLLLDQCNLNATSELVGLVWTAPSGKVSSYLVEVYEGTDRLGWTDVQPADGNPNIDSTPLRVPNIKNGHRYNVSITAQSMFYQLSETVDSDTYIEQIKTVVIGKYKI